MAEGCLSDFDPGNHKCPTALVFTVLAYRFCKPFTTHTTSDTFTMAKGQNKVTTGL